MLKNTFGKKKYFTLKVENDIKQQVVKEEEDMLGSTICPGCSTTISELELLRNHKVCPDCRHHFNLSVMERLNLTVDDGTFQELDSGLSSYNILNFPGYDEKLSQAEKNSGFKEAIITGKASIGGCPIILGIMDTRFMMGSMGSVVGEKVSRAFEAAINLKCPVIMFTASGGARMQEGILSLMQMAKTSAVLEKFNRCGLLYISVLTHPTTGGVSASFASLADIIIGEPGALVGFAGPRVIEQTIKQRLPEGFQQSEFLLKHGMVDMVVDRTQLRETLVRLLRLHQGGVNG
ncbi:MAG: acetyl-CoA carboxylase, carboxyltransferase subunit beta [Syntrophomonadaceae bacterium]|nr:acetyl-CoA carboxylase, carboxyltransferase subunit beta [Syntrophomonadaceae bacterium]